MPRLGFLASGAVVVLWGLAFVIVLTMISGARELMTPGAWKPDGLTYKLAGESPADAELLARRRRHLDDLRFQLWNYAASHEGKLPDGKQNVPAIDWEVPEGVGLQYFYHADRSLGESKLLVYEPALFQNRLALLADGEIRLLSESEFDRAIQQQPSP